MAHTAVACLQDRSETRCSMSEKGHMGASLALQGYSKMADQDTIGCIYRHAHHSFSGSGIVFLASAAQESSCHCCEAITVASSAY